MGARVPEASKLELPDQGPLQDRMVFVAVVLVLSVLRLFPVCSLGCPGPQRSTCLCLPRAGIKGMCYHDWPHCTDVLISWFYYCKSCFDNAVFEYLF